MRSRLLFAALLIFGGAPVPPSAGERHARRYRRIVGPQNGDIEMAEEIWAFFKDKRR